VRGSVKRRSVPVGLHDIASTVTSWFGLGAMPGADGRRLFPTSFERDLLLQGSFDANLSRSYTGLRTADGYKYVEYREGEAELYDLDADPMELTNLADAANHAALRRELAQRLAALRDCAEQTCR
jgi:arylsulfatase A-like enzyme